MTFFLYFNTFQTQSVHEEIVDACSGPGESLFQRNVTTQTEMQNVLVRVALGRAESAQRTLRKATGKKSTRNTRRAGG
jgi:hypothetical protein